MDTFVNRITRSFGKFSTAVSVAGVVLSLLGFLQLYADGIFGLESSVDAIRPTMRWHNNYMYGSTNTRKENAIFQFDLDADLSKVFNWNTKLVFAYVTADYNTTSKKTGETNYNSLVIWDKIIENKEDAVLKLRGQHSKYSVWGLQSAFGGSDREVQLNLRFSVQPRVGMLVNAKTEIEGGLVCLPPLQEKKPKAADQ